MAPRPWIPPQNVPGKHLQFHHRRKSRCLKEVMEVGGSLVRCVIFLTHAIVIDR